MAKVRIGKGTGERKPLQEWPCPAFPSLSAYVLDTSLIVPVIAHTCGVFTFCGTGTSITTLGTGVRTLSYVVFFLLELTSTTHGTPRTFPF